MQRVVTGVTSNPDGHVLPDISPWVFMGSSVYMAFIGLFGAVSNLTVIIAYWRVRSVRLHSLKGVQLVNFFLLS